MRKTGGRVIKTLITILAVINIIVMIGFEYGLPSLTEISITEQSSTEDENEAAIGTIEAVEKEAATKEKEAAESALAKEENIPEEDEEEQDPDAPILELTDEHIFLNVGERFNYMRYIETMQDVDGSDLSRYIHLDRDVDTSEPGDIELTYRITSAITGKSTSRTLLITIR